MIGYVPLGTNDMTRGVALYDAPLAEIGAKRCMEAVAGTAWAVNPATVGNGAIVALVVDSKRTVDRVYARTMQLGALNEGAPGPRGERS